MGKPTKPRVKGNLQPASSSRAAELSGAAHSLSFDNLGGFAQFASVIPTTTAGIVSGSRPSTPSSFEGFDSTSPLSSAADLDPELVFILKKLSKRDVVTKLKALEELQAYLQNNEKVIGSILHTWIGTYSKMSLEVDRRVRLAANEVNTLVTANAKKKLAPVLKDLIGPWLLSMYDQSKDIAQVARNAFESVFAPEKRLPAISFCQKEILQYITDMLLYKTADTLSDPRYVSKEDMMAKYARVVSSSFQILAYLTTSLTADERLKCQQDYMTILDDTTMWKKFATHGNALIRKSLYGFIKTLLLSWTEMVETRMDLICPSFFASVFKETDASTHSDMWDAVLLMTKKLPSSWIIIGKKKPALPKLYNFLRSGLNGSPKIAYPSLLALLANLPDELKSTANFHNDIFENFWKGLSTEYIDRSNSYVFLNAYAECIVYFVITLSKSSEENAAQIANALITNTFWDMIKVYFLNSRDKVITDKMDPNSGYAIIAKHFAVLAIIDNEVLKNCMSTLYSNMDELFVQAIIDCRSITTRETLDMSVFCQKTGNFLTAISNELNNINSKNNNNPSGEKGKILKQFVDDVSKRLLLASVESSIVHKSHSMGLLLLSSQIIHAHIIDLADKDLNKLLQASKQLLNSLTDDEFERTTSYFVSYYVALIAQLKRDSNKSEEAKELWLTLIKKLNETYQVVDDDEPTFLRGATILSQVWEQVLTEKVTLNRDDHCEALNDIINTSLDKLNDEALSYASRQLLESTVASTLGYHFSSHNLPASTANRVIEAIHSNLVAFNQYHYADKSTFAVSRPTIATLNTTLSAFKILNSLISIGDKKDNLKSLFASDTSNELCSEVFDVMFTASSIIKSATVEEDEMLEDGKLLVQILELATSLWQIINESDILQETEEQQQHLVTRVRKSISDIYYIASPSDSVQRIERLLAASSIKIWSFMIGTEKDWIQLNARSPGQQYTTGYLPLGIVDPYAIASSELLVDDIGELLPVKYDIYGLSAFGRLVSTWCEYFATNSKDMSPIMDDGSYDWVVRQIMLASISCEQGLSVLEASRSICNTKAIEGIRVFVERTSQQVFSDWLMTLTTSINDIGTWNDQLLKSVTTMQQQTNNEDRLLSFIAHLMNQKQQDNESSMVVESAVLLQHILQKLIVLGDWKQEHMEKWLPYLKPESSELDLLIKLAILTAFKNHLGQSNAYQHYQSYLASKLSGINASKGLQQFDYSIENPDSMKQSNWSMLCLLNASALKTESFDIPRQRLMYLIQALRPLLTDDSTTVDNDDDDFSTEYQKSKIQAQLAQLLKHLAVSVADVLGGHWDWFLQCCFEWTAFKDTATQPEELLLVYHALDLFHTLFELSAAGQEEHAELQNEELHDIVKEHMRPLSKSLLQLMAKEQEYLKELEVKNEMEVDNVVEDNNARLTYQTLLSDLLEHIPENVLFDDEYFSNFNALIHTPNEVLQKRAYLLLKKYIAHKTQDLSVQLEFTETSEEETRANIHDEILATLLSPPEITLEGILEIEEQLTNNVLAYLLTWMLMFDHFTDITFKLKQEYTSQLKEKEAVSYLMPLLCKILNIGTNSSSAKKAFDLSPWSVLEYNIEGFDASFETSFSLLAGHLYYRALLHIPSLIRQWWIDCKNRQLTIAVENYTEKHFSQLLIQHELELVNRPDIKSQLEENEDNEFNVKTLKGANEVTATYKVDEQNMQIAIKLPSNFPLRQIDVEGIQKVGVNDKQWRGWMFAVAAVISSQNGNIVDALTVFKRNVNLHFNGVEDCTICYSIISIQDRSIPTKQCRTCKNKFHSSCLYKWFRSSNSASCPLCRTVF